MAKVTMKDKCVIDRSKWARGGKFSDYGCTGLLNKNGTMCCLGFWSRQVPKMPKAEIRPYGIPLPAWLGNHDKCLYGAFHAIATINDSRELTEKERERLVKTAFREVLDCKVEFVGRSPGE